MFAMTIIVLGLAGFAVRAVQALVDQDKPQELSATVAKMRLDTKKVDGAEFYTYILTFYIHEKDDYAHFEVSQAQFDVTIEKDTGKLLCDLEQRRFFEWKAVKCEQR